MPKSNYFLRIMDIFVVERSEQVLVMHERFTIAMSMQHKLWSGKWSGAYKTYDVKQWAIQLAKAVEIINQAGVVHRFVRPENILLLERNGQITIKLTSFDFACRYWDAQSETTIGLAPKLPLDLEPHLLDHLPPECFTRGYDGSMVDVWSIGTIICLMLTEENPFEVPWSPDGGETPPVDYIQQWKRCEERRMLPAEIRSLLDDIFRDADSRICAWELAKDIRLCKSTKQVEKMKLPTYYRIDLTKNQFGRTRTDSTSKGSKSEVPEGFFSPESKHIFALKGYKKLKDGEEAEIKDYRVLREASFEGDGLSPSVILNDYYLKAARSGQTEADCLVKILSSNRIPVRQRNLLLGESCRIMKYMSSNSPNNCHIHRVLDMYDLANSIDPYIYIFYENLQKHESIYQVVLPPPNSSSISKFPPSLHSTGSLLSITNIQAWIHALAQTVDSMAKLGLSHRYIRPEYVFVSKTEPNKIKLSHFDQACFVWEPVRSTLVPRTCGIQDEMEHLWNHLPPECYDQLYDCRQVDVWSVAVLLAFCLTGKMPFTTPFTVTQAGTQWSEFKRINSNLMENSLVTPSTQLLDLIFVPEEERLKVAQLVDKSVASKLIPQQRPRSSEVAQNTKSSTDSGPDNDSSK